MSVIQLVPLGTVPPEELDHMAASIAARFGGRAEILASAPLPPAAWRPARRQHDADAILEYLFDRLDPDVSRLIAATDVDLFAEGRNFVFGYAHMRDRVAVFSTLRLREGAEGEGRAIDHPVYRARIDKALTHELGHTFHVPHCPTEGCVMHQVEFLWQLDGLLPDYCADCAERIRRGMARGPHDPETLYDLGGSYMRRRRYARAAAAYARAAAAAPLDANVHNDHGVALLALGDRRGAEQAFRRALGLKPESPYPWYNLGIVHREQGDVPGADRLFAEALRRDDDQLAALRYLGVLHQDYFRDHARAREYLERFRALGGRDLEVLRRLRALAPATPAEGDAAPDEGPARDSVAPA